MGAMLMRDSAVFQAVMLQVWACTLTLQCLLKEANKEWIVAFAGLWYLTLYLSAKFRIAAPRYTLGSSGGGDSGAHEQAQSGDDENDAELVAFLPQTNAPRQGQLQQAT